MTSTCTEYILNQWTKIPSKHRQHRLEPARLCTVIVMWCTTLHHIFPVSFTLSRSNLCKIICNRLVGNHFTCGSGNSTMDGNNTWPQGVRWEHIPPPRMASHSQISRCCVNVCVWENRSENRISASWLPASATVSLRLEPLRRRVKCYSFEWNLVIIAISKYAWKVFCVVTLTLILTTKM